MNEERLIIHDAACVFTGAVPGPVADAVVASLSAEPETIRELEDAVARFIKPVHGSPPLLSFECGAAAAPPNAGIVVIDIPARVVAAEPSCSHPSPTGSVRYHDGARLTSVQLPYKVADDWLFVYSIAEYNSVRGIRLARHAASPRLDARAVLFGSVAEFIRDECDLARGLDLENPAGLIHAKWLMTPRNDLNGLSPREVLLAKREFIDDDLSSRELQWSLLHEPAPSLKPDCAAYRFAGFGTHAFVMYYDLVRVLISECWRSLRDRGKGAGSAEVVRLKQIQAEWLEKPDPEYGGRSPASIFDCERMRIPLLMTAGEMELDDDCPFCRMMSKHPTPTFCHFDGSSMDEDFPFSFFETREEWEEVARHMEEFSAEFDREWGEESIESRGGKPGHSPADPPVH